MCYELHVLACERRLFRERDVYYRIDRYSTTHETAAVKLVTEASQSCKIRTRGKKNEGSGSVEPRVSSFAGNSERQAQVEPSMLAVVVASVTTAVSLPVGARGGLRPHSLIRN
ncbi:hypothetical protein EVAR_81456_1 [Eumeta japonica]|uniref:Uncharacterized protein n=1 Tax=Eumeta variegata TaxID=151549 RepID=A0A4C1W249_EUMVA|nr:hypothetical protein EVAR_81456_1 [Eumeta japonica]